MAPDSSKDESLHPEVLEKLVAPQAGPRKYDVVLFNAILFGYWHLAAIYGLYLCFTSAKWSTILFNIFIYTIAELGMTAGAHRLWSHKAYKAKLPLQILLMLFNSIAFQNTVIDWVRDHRLHHKYSDTDADPHNAVRGFFYSHVGWLLVRKHPEVKRRGKLIDLSDIHANPVLRFQKNMPYTEACIREVMRMDVLVPMGVPHRARKATTIGGYDLPENTAIAGNFKALNYDTEIWGDPENFRPERYIEDGKLNPAKDRSLPFGAGHRLCAGETFARQSMFQVFAGFMQAFQVSPVNNQPYIRPVTRINGIITTMPELWVRVTPR